MYPALESLPGRWADMALTWLAHGAWCRSPREAVASVT